VLEKKLSIFCSSSSYDLSGFSSGAGPEVVYVESSSSSIGNDWFDASVVPHGVLVLVVTGLMLVLSPMVFRTKEL
jgi:hypothetical protein